ncbi:MAG: hypothetical protein HYS06_08825 [Methylocystis sp.]|nr:hypothetical protein [Methylocystis sp.]
MTGQRPHRPDEPYHAEPEILPPERSQRDEAESASWTRVFIDERGVRRVYVGKIGPLGLIGFALVAGIVAAAALILMLGAVALLIPLAGLLVGTAALAALARAYFRRPH